MIKRVTFIFTIFMTIALFGKEKFSSERFIGIETGYGEVQSRNVIGVPSSATGVEFGFRFGAQNEKWRTTISGHNLTKRVKNILEGFLKPFRLGFYSGVSPPMEKPIRFPYLKPLLGVHHIGLV